MSISDDTKKKMDDSISHLLEELKNIRTGRANPGMVDCVPVEVYGTTMNIKDLATVTCP